MEINKKYDVFGLGNALMDIQVFVKDELLEQLNIPKGVMHLVDEEKSKELLEAINSYEIKTLPGGSCANTLSMLTLMGSKGVYTGVVSDDIYGRLYEREISERGVKPLIEIKKTNLTGTAIILTTEDAERTMITHLGACREYTRDNIDLEALAESKVFHCTGYQWDTPSQKEAVVEAMKSAKKYDSSVSFDIADPFCIERNVEDFKEIIKNHVDILFGNKDEVKILTGESDPIAAGKKILQMGAKIALVKIGSEGSYLFYDDKVETIPVYKAENVLDSTGCGDIYAGGFLYGYSKNYSLVESAHIASYLAGKIIQVPGVQLEKFDYTEIHDFIKSKILKK